MADRTAATLHRWAVVTVLCTFGLIVAGALVTSRDAGLAVPDWPLSFGTINPPRWYAIENVRTEHGHRLIAGCVALLTLALGVRVWRSDTTSAVRRLSALAVFMVLLQALLGGLRVLHLSVDLAMVHGWLGQAFFCVVVSIATLTSPRWTGSARRAELDTGKARAAAWLTALLVSLIVTQLVVGLVIRHLGESARPLLGNGLFYTHAGVALVVAWAALRLRTVLHRDGVGPRERSRLERRADTIAALVMAQLALGFGTFVVTETMHYDRQATVIEAWLPTLHVALGAALLGTAVSIALHAWAAHGAERSTLAPAGHAQAAGAR